MIIGALEAMKFAVRGAKAGGGCQRGKVSARRFFHRCGQRAGGQSVDKGARAGFQRLEIGRGIFGCLPRILEARGIVVADDGVALTLGSVPSAPIWGTVGEMPSQEEGEIR